MDEEEKKCSKIKNAVLELKEQIEKNNVASSQPHQTGFHSLQKPYKQQKAALEEKVAANTRVVTRVSNLATLCKKSNKHIIEESRKISKL